MFTDYTVAPAIAAPVEITLYGLSIGPNGHTSKIRGIKALRTVATLQGFDLSLRHAKLAVEGMEHGPLVVMCAANEAPIVREALRPWFELDKPELRTKYLAQFFTSKPVQFDCMSAMEREAAGRSF